MPGKPGLMDHSKLARANPQEIFNAITQPGTAIPPEFGDRFGAPKLGQQGWLLGEIQPTAHTTNWCNTNAFTDIVEYWDLEHTLLRLNERPTDHPERWVLQSLPDDFFVTDPSWLYRATVYNVDEFYTRVAVCEQDGDLLLCTSTFSCAPYEPWIQFRYRDHNNNPGEWGIAFYENVPTNGVGYSAWWHFYTGMNWDWRVQIHGAEGDEKFNIGLTWVD
jgi:hypothetical protein